MNEKFYELPEEKQMRIINAALEVFSQNEYKRASTDEIARIAGTSKGLLFYYFHNKKELYFFLHEYAAKTITTGVVDKGYQKITDFFQLCQYAAEKKFELLQRTPYIMDFLVRAFYSQHEDVSEEMNKNLLNATSGMFSTFFKTADLTKFKDDVDPKEILQMLTWMIDGYLHEKQRAQGGTTNDEDMALLMDKYQRWAEMLKQISYKEEYVK